MNTASINDKKLERSVKGSFIDRFAKKKVMSILAGITEGRLVIDDGGKLTCFGESTDKCSMHAHMFIHHPSAYRDILFGGSIGAAESYMLGSWTSSNLVDVVRVMSKNIDLLNGVDGSRFLLQRAADKIYHWFNRNTEANAKANISAHYDLSNDFFSLFLDNSMMYSAAMFPSADSTLEQASYHKIDQICQKLNLVSGDHLLEIGTGWGGLAVYAASHYGCRVTTTTISRQQYEFACQRVKDAGLEDKITVLFKDYRQLEGLYDKLVSVEMIEAVGHKFYGEYFSTCSSLLKKNGLMMVQAITIPDQRYNYAKKSVDFIQKYIFPGGCLPSDKILADNISRRTDMQIIDMEEIGEDYARTLELWRLRFHDRLDEVKALGFDDVFIRMWEYYLCYCEGGFRERVIGTGQFLLAKPQWTRQES